MTENFGDLEKMSSLILILVFVSGVVMICLVFLFWLKGRVHEIGIYLSLGRTKCSIDVLSGISVLGMIILAITLSCISIMIQKPKEILSRMS